MLESADNQRPIQASTQQKNQYSGFAALVAGYALVLTVFVDPSTWNSGCPMWRNWLLSSVEDGALVEEGA